VSAAPQEFNGSSEGATTTRRGLLLGAAGLALGGTPASGAYRGEGIGSVTSTDFDADPSGSSDSTAALNKALAMTRANGRPAHAGKTLVIRKGTYRVTDTLKLGTRQHVVFEPGVIIDATGLPTETTSLFVAANQTDVTLEGNGAELIGARAKAASRIEGSQVGIYVYGSAGVLIEAFRIRDFATDGITIGGDHKGSAPSRSVTVKDCTVRNCRRNGLSIIDCVGATVIGGLYAGSHGAPSGPWAGIDIEPDANQRVISIVLKGVKTADNAGPGVLFVPAGAATSAEARYDVELIGGESRGDGSADGLPGLQFTNGAGISRHIDGQVVVRNFRVLQPKSSGVAFKNWDADRAPRVTLEGVSVVDPDSTASARGNANRTAFVIHNGKQQVPDSLGNIELIDCHAEDTRTPPRMVRGAVLAADPGKAVKNVVVKDFSTTNALAALKYDVSTAGSLTAGGLVNVQVLYSKQSPVAVAANTDLAELGGKLVRAMKNGATLKLPPAGNCTGLTYEIEAAQNVTGTVIAAESGDSIVLRNGQILPQMPLPAGRRVRLKSLGEKGWSERAATP
jgi:hypothetical protein